MIRNILDYIKYFFRTVPEVSEIENLGKIHLILLFISILGSFFIIIYKENFKNKINSIKIEKIFFSTLLFQQVFLYSWYILPGNRSNESLPFFHCRIAIIFTILALKTDKKEFKIVSSYWGIMGSILALLFLGLDPFLFPHVTIFSYFIGHIFLLWTSVYFIATENIIIDKNSLKEILIFTNIYNISIYILNYFVHANYSYVTEPPFFKEIIFNIISPITYSFIIIVVFNLFMLLIYKIIQKIYLLENNKINILNKYQKFN